MLEGPQRLLCIVEGGVSVSLNEAPRSKLQGYHRTKIVGDAVDLRGRFGIWSGPEGVFLTAFEQAESRRCR